MLIGGVNAFNNKIGETINPLNGEYESVPKVARALKASGKLSVIVGDHNYGEGSSREHAAMEPKHLGVLAVLVKSFARIHETNLKKQGMLAITFSNEADYDKIQENDSFNFTDLRDFAPGKQLTIVLDHRDGTKDTIKVNHTYNEQQIEWFRAGSALNYLRK
jgi:aconitate hydratase